MRPFNSNGACHGRPPSTRSRDAALRRPDIQDSLNNGGTTSADRQYRQLCCGRAYSLLGFRIVDGVVGAGFPRKPAHSAVFAQIAAEGSRLTDLARRANMSPQAMGELVDELEQLDYVVAAGPTRRSGGQLIYPDQEGTGVHRRRHRHHRRYRAATGRPPRRSTATSSCAELLTKLLDDDDE